MEDYHYLKEGSKKGTCYKCGEHFKQLYIHFQRVHLRHLQPRFTCNYCSKEFIRKDSLKVHMQTHSPDKPYICLDCNKNFTLKKYLKQHQTVHKEPQYHCPTCQQAFPRKQSLKRHMRLKNH